MKKVTEKKNIVPLEQGASTADLVAMFLSKRERVMKLPKLSDHEQVAFDNNLDLDHLYNSSKVEGTILTQKQMRDALHG